MASKPEEKPAQKPAPKPAGKKVKPSAKDPKSLVKEEDFKKYLKFRKDGKLKRALLIGSNGKPIKPIKSKKLKKVAKKVDPLRQVKNGKLKRIKDPKLREQVKLERENKEKEIKARKEKRAKLIKEGKKPKSGPGKPGKPRNYELKSGIYRFSKSKMYHKKAKWKFVGIKHPQSPKKRTPALVVRRDKSEKGYKLVAVAKKRRASYPTVEEIKKAPSRSCFSKHKRYVRKSLVPGRIVILLAGRHKGKRVVVVKILGTGLLLVTGPYKVNGCPLRRISQNYVMATKTKLNFKSVKIPEHLDDDYFKRIKPKKPKKTEGDIFATKKEKYKVTKRRKTDQNIVDNQVIKSIRRRGDKGILVRYLKSMFSLRKNQRPHRIKF